MYTQCANHECEAAFQVTAETLRSAMGMVRCTECSTVFNALSTIMDKKPAGDVTELEAQLKFTESGDKIVIDASTSARLLSTLGRARSAADLAADDAPLSDEDSDSDIEDNIDELVPEASPLSAISADDESVGNDETDAHRQATLKKRTEMDDLEEAMPGISSISKTVEPEEATSNEYIEYLPSLTDLKHAFRNLLRQRKRSVMGLAAISFGVIALLLAGGFIEWNNWALREATIQSRLGHIQIVKPGYFEVGEADPYSFLLPGDQSTIDEIEQKPEVEAVAPRLSFTGLISHGETSLPFKAEGVVPEKEGSVSRQMTIIDGENLSSGENGVIIGKGLAVNLGVSPGDSVVLLSTPSSGGMGAVEATVKGIFQTSSKPFDDASLRVPIDIAQQLVRVDGAHSWVVLLKDTEMTDDVVADLRDEYQSQNEFQFVPWLDLAEFYKKVVVLFTAQVNLVRVIIALIILVSISNTLIMAVNERVSEIGTLMALGLKRKRIIAIFMSEGLILGLVGGILGALLGWALAIIISNIGIPMPPSPGMDYSLRGEIIVTVWLALGAVMLGIVATIIASIYPARKASMLEIVDALRHSK